MNKQKILFWIIDCLGINALFRFFNHNKAIILWYHGVCDDEFQLLDGYDKRHIQKSDFEKQLQFLKRKDYNFVTMSELVAALGAKKDIRKYVVLTFDDGFKNVVENGYPIMKEFNAKGCIYLVSGLIGKNKLLWTDYVETVVRNHKGDEFKFIYKGKTLKYKLNGKKSNEQAMQDIKNKLRLISDKERKEHLRQFTDVKMNDAPKEFRISNWDQIRSLNKNILEVGSHTINHPNCANLTSNDELDNEIRDSRLQIEKMVGYKVDHFCYPAGSYNENVIEHLKKYGFASATTIHPGFNDTTTDLCRLKRISTGGDMLQFKAKISGSYYFLGMLKHKFKGE